MTQTTEALASTTAVVKRTFDPMAPVGTAGSLKNLLETQRSGIAQALPKHVTPERLIKTLLVAANRTPDLLLCTQASILETINRAAELGLDLSGTLGEAYPVPFNNKIRDSNGERWAKQCQLIIGYRGFVKLARQSGEIKRIEADVVYANDDFVFRKGTDARCDFTPFLKGDRGEAVGAYAYVEFKDGGEQFDFMPTQDIEKVRARSKSGSDKSGNAIGAWKSDWAEMAKKTIFRRVAKWLPLSTEKFVAAMEQDEADYQMADVLSAETTASPRGAAGVLAKVRQNTVVSGPSEGQTTDTSTSQVDADADAEAEATLAAAAAKAKAAAVPEKPETPLPIDAPSEHQADESQIDDGPDADPAVVLEQRFTAMTPDQRKADCLSRAKDHGITRKDFEGGFFKWSRKWDGKLADIPVAEWIALFKACVAKKFNVLTGAVEA